MQMKFEFTDRERKYFRKFKKNKTSDHIYSSKHIREYERLVEWSNRNNQQKGRKSRHIS